MPPTTLYKRKSGLGDKLKVLGLMKFVLSILLFRIYWTLKFFMPLKESKNYFIVFHRTTLKESIQKKNH